MYGTFVLLDDAGELEMGTRVYLGDLKGKNEAWLRDTLFANPEIIPTDDIDPTFGPLVPLCKELRTDAGQIDALFINERGRLMPDSDLKTQAGTLRLRGKDIQTQTKDLDQKNLRFFSDNPRIYSLVKAAETVPSQQDIMNQLLTHEHVKELIHDIKSNGGLIDPLIVRDGDLVVLEGNSRLAACRFLASKDPIQWSKVKCTVLPADIDEQLIFALLGQYHVKGKKDWVPYEKAGFLHRRHKTHQIELSVIAADLGIKSSEAKHLCSVYDFMLIHKDQDREHWSYYDEYLKSSKIKKVRDEFSEFDNFVVEEIKSEKIGKAVDLRDKLPVICSGPGKILRRYLSGKLDFADAYENAVDAGSENFALKRLRKFRECGRHAHTSNHVFGCLTV